MGVGEAEARGRDGRAWEGPEVRGEAVERETEEGDRRRHARHGVRRNAQTAMNFGGDKQGIALAATVETESERDKKLAGTCTVRARTPPASVR